MTESLMTYQVGLALRGHFRAHLDVVGVKWTEHKNWGVSTFVVRGDRDQIRLVGGWVARVLAA